MVKKDKEGDLLKVIEFGEGDWPLLLLVCDIFANLLTRYYKDSPKSLEVVGNDFQAARSLDENMKPKGTKLNVQNKKTQK